MFNRLNVFKEGIGTTIMKKIGLVLIILIMIITGFLSGCNSLNSDKDKFVGTWKTSLGITSALFSDGTCTIAGVSGTWDIKDSHLVVVLANLPTQSTFTYFFSNDDKTVTLTDISTNISTTYTKQ